MTLTLTLPPEKEAALNAVAQAQGVSTEQWLQRLVEERLQSTEPTSASRLSRRPLSSRIREIWANLPDEARAEYPEGGAHQIDHHVYGLPKSRETFQAGFDLYAAGDLRRGLGPLSTDCDRLKHG